VADPSPISLDVLGRRLVVTCTEGAAAAAVRETFADLVTDASGDPIETVDFGGPLGPDSWTGLLGALRRTVQALAHGRVMPRAAAVAGSDGSTALLCADPGAGVTTLTAELVRRGRAYLTDETALLDPATLEVAPFREPLSLDGRLVVASTLSTIPVPGEPLEVRLLVRPSYDARAGGVHTTRLSEGEAAYLVGSGCARLDEVSGGALPALARLARRVPAYEVRYADHRRAAEEVTRLWPPS
jgi:hypothetical protein